MRYNADMKHERVWLHLAAVAFWLAVFAVCYGVFVWFPKPHNDLAAVGLFLATMILMETLAPRD